MKFILTDKLTELILPVTPDKFSVARGMKIETINIHTLGDVIIAGYGTLGAIKIDCIFPAHAYPFVQPGAQTNDPYSYVEKIEDWIESKAVLRYIISDTPVNEPVLIEEISFGEQDGTGDVYASITLRQYREVTAVQVRTVENSVRKTEAAVTTVQTYSVISGDTLSAICRRFYGKASLYPKLATYNSIKNANLIRVGQIIKLPDVSLL